MKKTGRNLTVLAIFMLIFVESSSDAQAGGISGVASEWTQILNNIQLTISQSTLAQTLENDFEHLQHELTMIQNAESQTQSLVNSTISVVNPDKIQVFGTALKDMQELSQIVQKGRGLAYSMANLDTEFANRYQGYATVTKNNYSSQYRSWAQTSLDTTHNTLNAMGVQSQQLTNDNQLLLQLQQKSQSSAGMLQAVQAATQISAQEVNELQKLRQLMMADIASKQAYQSQQLAEGMATDDMDGAFFTPLPDTNSDTRTFSPIPQ